MTDAIVKILRNDAVPKGTMFHRVHAVPDDPVALEETTALGLVILGPDTPHSGKGEATSEASRAVRETLTRYKASQRRYRNTLMFLAGDEAELGKARQAMRKAIAWEKIAGDKPMHAQLLISQVDDAKTRAVDSLAEADKAVRTAWKHLLYPFKDEHTPAGAAFHMEHLTVQAKDRVPLAVVAYEKATKEGAAREQLGGTTLARDLKPLWPEERPHLPVSEVVEWFASYPYLPRLRDEVVLREAIRSAVVGTDPSFAYADEYDVASDRYLGLREAKAPTEPMPSTAVLVRLEVARALAPAWSGTMPGS